MKILCSIVDYKIFISTAPFPPASAQYLYIVNNIYYLIITFSLLIRKICLLFVKDKERRVCKLSTENTNKLN